MEKNPNVIVQDLRKKASSKTFGNIKEGMWFQLMKNESEVNKQRKILEEGLGNKLGNGESIYFWKNSLCCLNSLKNTFPRFFSISA